MEFANEGKILPHNLSIVVLVLFQLDAAVISENASLTK